MHTTLAYRGDNKINVATVRYQTAMVAIVIDSLLGNQVGVDVETILTLHVILHLLVDDKLLLHYNTYATNNK